MIPVPTYIAAHTTLISNQVSLHPDLVSSEMPDRIRVVFAKIYTVVLLWSVLRELSLINVMADISYTVQLR